MMTIAPPEGVSLKTSQPDGTLGTNPLILRNVLPGRRRFAVPGGKTKKAGSLPAFLIRFGANPYLLP
ncbi:MAG: hypothetical protein J0I79_17770 [Mesorhizobium sp.]|uniref:hypothetical protein n=1 Tax=Mesorhizobium sp. TaxID=1871066 RepID=UPI001AC25334|nr:hypothetical protein [Mesorhizobium sp.]MBN9219794.1 hypothetical protein [Mesorhizobium sp.]